MEEAIKDLDFPEDAEVEDSLVEKALDTLHEAKGFDLPKGYGRD